MPQIKKVSPSSVYCNVRIGQVIRVGGKKHMLVGYDAVNASFVRYHWIDHWLYQIANWFGRTLQNVKESYANRR